LKLKGPGFTTSDTGASVPDTEGSVPCVMLLQSNAVEAWIDSGVSVETLANVINTSYSTDYATTRLSEMTGITEPLIKEIVRLPLDELSQDFFQNRLNYYSQAAEVLEML